MADSLFLYTSPFVITDSPSARQEHLIDYLSDEERIEERKIHAILLKFSVVNKLVNEAPVGVDNSTGENMGSWVWVMNWMDARSLVDIKAYDKLMSSLQSADGHPVALIIDLHQRLGSLFEHRLLNTLANRVMQSVGLIPYPVHVDSREITWETIHNENPFIWILILIQVVFRTEMMNLT